MNPIRLSPGNGLNNCPSPNKTHHTRWHITHRLRKLFSRDLWHSPSNHSTSFLSSALNFICISLRWSCTFAKLHFPFLLMTMLCTWQIYQTWLPHSSKGQLEYHHDLANLQKNDSKPQNFSNQDSKMHCLGHGKFINVEKTKHLYLSLDHALDTFTEFQIMQLIPGSWLVSKTVIHCWQKFTLTIEVYYGSF